jgi:hypothetical protein
MLIDTRNKKEHPSNRCNMVPFDLTAVLKNAPIGEWIALSFARDRIVATAHRLSDARKAAIDAGEPRPIMMKLPPVGILIL